MNNLNLKSKLAIKMAKREVDSENKTFKAAGRLNICLLILVVNLCLICGDNVPVISEYNLKFFTKGKSQSEAAVKEVLLWQRRSQN